MGRSILDKLGWQGRNHLELLWESTDIRLKITRYHERNLQQKLEILYQRNLYILAINLAQKAGIDTLQQNVIFRKYGDYLYQKGDYDTAMQQYLRAIENTEPSQVIRKVCFIIIFQLAWKYLTCRSFWIPNESTILLNIWKSSTTMTKPQQTTRRYFSIATPNSKTRLNWIHSLKLPVN
jgi:tetratricopeptide (TPR) repeat protein